MGRTIVIIGFAIAAIGLLLMIGERLPVRWGRLPGDFVWQGRNTTVYLPLATMLILNSVLWLVVWLMRKR